MVTYLLESWSSSGNGGGVGSRGAGGTYFFCLKIKKNYSSLDIQTVYMSYIVSVTDITMVTNVTNYVTMVTDITIVMIMNYYNYEHAHMRLPLLQ